MRNKLKLTGVILCAGKGTRIKKLPFNKPKALAEVLGQPIIYYQLKYFKEIGIKKVLIVVGKSGNKIIKKIKSISNLNLNISFIKDLKPGGIAHSLNKTKSFIKGPILVFLGDIFFRKAKLGKLLKKFNNSNSSCVLACIKEKNISKIKKNFTIKTDKNSLVTEVIEKPKKPKTNIKGIGVYLFSKNIFEAIKQTSKNQNKSKELGITESIQTLINNGNKVYSSICVEEDVNINEPMDLWETNIKLLKKLNKKNFISKKVYIGRNVSIINSIVGPNVSIGDGSVVKDSIIFSNVILNKKTVLIGSIMTEEGFVKLK